MSYESGKAQADAPVTWSGPNDDGNYVVWKGIKVLYELDAANHTDKEMDELCQWAHLAKLAGEAEERMQSLVTDCFQDNLEDPCGTGTVADMRQQGFERIAKSQVDKANDWLRRFRAAKGDA